MSGNNLDAIHYSLPRNLVISTTISSAYPGRSVYGCPPGARFPGRNIITRLTMTDQIPDVELASLIGGIYNSIGPDDGDAAEGRKANPVPARANIGRVRAGLTFRLLAIFCILPGIVAMMLLLLLGAGTLDEYGGTSNKVGDSWVNMRWQPTTVNDMENCPPHYRLANATIHCGIGDLSPINVSSDGKRYCGGVPMQPNYCTLPTAGGWAAPELTLGVEVSIPPYPHRLGIHRRDINLPRCKTLGEFVNGSYEGVGFDQEWVPKSCSAVSLSPFAWTEHTKCQATITMVVSNIIYSPQTTDVSL